MEKFKAENDHEALQDMLGRADTPFSEFPDAISVPLELSQGSLSFEFDDSGTLQDVKIIESGESEGFLLHLKIQDRPFGPITEEALEHFWPGSRSSVNLGSSGQVHINGIPKTKDQQCLFVDFVPGVMGPPSGAIWLSPLPSGLEYYYSYQIMFPTGFDFNTGGELPGIGGGLSANEMLPAWEQAFQWGPSGTLFVRIPGQSDTQVIHAEGLSKFQFSTNTWYTIKAHMKLNSEGKVNGVFELWINDEKFISQSDVFLLSEGNVIEWIAVKAFFSKEVPKRCSVCFQEFILSTSQIQD